jgi:competence protein ComEC
MLQAMPPLVRATALAVAGVVVGLRSGVSTELLIAAAGLAGAWAAAVASGVLRREAAVLTVFAAAGVALGAAERTRLARDCRTQWPDGARITVAGAFEGVPGDRRAAAFRVRAVQATGWVRCEGSIRVRLPRDAVVPEPGRPLRVAGRFWVHPAPAGGWPRRPEHQGTLTATVIEPVDGPGSTLLRLRGAAQQRLRRTFGARAGTAEALILARRDALDPALRDRFARAGMSHLLAISGMHVGMIAAGLLLAGRVLRLGPARSGLFAGAATLGYVLLIGAPAAAARAALQIGLLLLARLLQRPSDPMALMAAAALVLVVRDPLAPLDAGFQLSFAGVWGLLAFRRTVRDALPAALPRPLAEAVAANVAATATTAPIAALHFGLFSWIGLLANLAATPALGLAVPAVAAALAADWIGGPAAGAFLAGGAGLALDLLEGTARLAAEVPGGHAVIASTDVAIALAACAAAVWTGGRLRAGSGPATAARQRLLRAAAAGAAALGVAAVAPVADRGGRGLLEIHAIDVGQGDALAIRSPRGRWIVVDAGPASADWDAGRARVVPYLLARGARRIDVLVLTHPHADHIGGARALLEAFRVDAILDPAIPAGSDLYLETLRGAAARATRWHAARAGRELRIDDVTLHFLAPHDSLARAPPDPNDFSVVFRLAYGAFAALFLGDAPASVEDALAAEHGGDLRAHVLKVGHHGSRTSTGTALLAGARPAIGLVSAGARNSYGHPDAGVLGRLRRHGVHVLRTDLNGSLTVRARPDGRVEWWTER